MATYDIESKVIALVVMLACMLALGWMEAQDAELMERSSVQVAQK